MRVTSPYDARNVEIEVKGKEKTKWTETVTRTENQNGESRTHTEHIKHKDHHSIYNFKGPCF